MPDLSTVEALAVFVFVVVVIGTVMHISRTYYGEGIYTINTVLPAKGTEAPCVIGDYQFRNKTWKGIKIEVESIDSYHVGQMYKMRHCRVGTQYVYSMEERQYDSSK